MKITPLKFLKFWMMVSFSREMWGSWYFIFFYFLILTSNLNPENNTLHKWPLQVAMMVFIALFFGLMATIMGLIKFKERERVERETQQRMAYAQACKEQQKQRALIEFIEKPIGNTSDAEVTEFIKANIRLK